MELVRRLYSLKGDAEKLRQAREEELIGEQLYERMVSQKGQEMTAVSRYLQRLEQAWAERRAQLTGVQPLMAVDEEIGIAELLAGPGDEA
jgi:hypothetical protein